MGLRWNKFISRTKSLIVFLMKVCNFVIYTIEGISKNLFRKRDG
jgi:hypothetical protein